MNSNREIFTYNIIEPQIIINPNWFIGFIEGEVTFGIKTGSSMYFQVAQKNTSQVCLNAIVYFLTRLPKNSLQDTRKFSNSNPVNSEGVDKIFPLNVKS